jgi:5-methylcytosine-specific restriction endonuclease McrA
MYRRPKDQYGNEDLRYPENWLRLRGFVFRRDHFTCQLCGRTGLKHPQCDHIRPIGLGGSSHPNNLRTLCEICHSRRHHKR